MLACSYLIHSGQLLQRDVDPDYTNINLDVCTSKQEGYSLHSSVNARICNTLVFDMGIYKETQRVLIVCIFEKRNTFVMMIYDCH